eukprot:2556808-Prymnesium_polylepis.1
MQRVARPTYVVRGGASGLSTASPAAARMPNPASCVAVRALYGRCGDSLDGLGLLVGPCIPKICWSPETHADFPRRTRCAIVTAMLCSRRAGCLLAWLDNDLLRVVLTWVASWTVYPAGYDILDDEKKFPHVRQIPPGSTPAVSLTKYTKATEFQRCRVGPTAMSQSSRVDAW